MQFMFNLTDSCDGISLFSVTLLYISSFMYIHILSVYRFYCFPSVSWYARFNLSIAALNTIFVCIIPINTHLVKLNWCLRRETFQRECKRKLWHEIKCPRYLFSELNETLYSVMHVIACYLAMKLSFSVCLFLHANEIVHWKIAFCVCPCRLRTACRTMTTAWRIEHGKKQNQIFETQYREIGYFIENIGFSHIHLCCTFRFDIDILGAGDA